MALNLHTDLEINLKGWIANHDPHVRAAVELLIEHGYWLRNGHFVRAAVKPDGSGVYIDWAAARQAYERGDFSLSSSTERGVLRFAIDLGSERYGLARMGAFNRRALMRALSTALPEVTPYDI